MLSMRACADSLRVSQADAVKGGPRFETHPSRRHVTQPTVTGRRPICITDGAGAAHPQGATGGGAGRDLHRDGVAVQQRDRHGGAQHGFVEGDRHRDAQVRALGAPDRVLLDVEGQQQIAGGGPAGTGTALAAQADLLPVMHSRRDAGGDRATVDRQPQIGAQRRVAEADAGPCGGVGALRRARFGANPAGPPPPKPPAWPPNIFSRSSISGSAPPPGADERRGGRRRRTSRRRRPRSRRRRGHPGRRRSAPPEPMARIALRCN